MKVEIISFVRIFGSNIKSLALTHWGFRFRQSHEIFSFEIPNQKGRNEWKSFAGDKYVPLQETGTFFLSRKIVNPSGYQEPWTAFLYPIFFCPKGPTGTNRLPDIISIEATFDTISIATVRFGRQEAFLT
ncbi:hypothetical protein CDAR_524391 [Caerostris darwini]|uniref:Uncharacterized protein n=1 Tax=Caerostris darwini TaxID=1538125 RepID=A0AAV4VYB1_9ARAC|nr:hypothetical protein CDAR_524391 [Caerostris darwini]